MEKNGTLDRIKKRYIIIGLSIFVFLSILYILNGFYWRAKCDQTMELFGTALINRDLDLLDTLFERECDMITTEGRGRKYYYQRGVIAENWEKREYQVTLYHYDYIERPQDFWSFFRSSKIGGVCELRIIDAYGEEYRLSVIMTISRSDGGRIISTNALLRQNPTYWGL